MHMGWAKVKLEQSSINQLQSQNLEFPPPPPPPHPSLKRSDHVICRWRPDEVAADRSDPRRVIRVFQQVPPLTSYQVQHRDSVFLLENQETLIGRQMPNRRSSLYNWKTRP